jgi:hypothetical protein
MMTQSLDRGTSHTDLFGSPDPTKNRAYQRAQALTPNEIEETGFNHGFNNRGMLGSLSASPFYQQGYKRGSKARF